MTPSWLPGNEPGSVRSSKEVSQRALALFAVVAVALAADRREVARLRAIQWLSKNNLWDALAPSEIRFLNNPDPSHQERINASWLPERLIVLAWSLGGVQTLPEGDELCDPNQFTQCFPPSAGIGVEDFVANATLRTEPELIALADEILSQHWEARDAKLNARPLRRPVNIEIVQERHHAINWVIGYCGLAWDEVTTDT